ncbi:MAG: alkaline phosphatase [Planctomycetia bacterium]|nr:alkaline phosphatase [Planctomycetia bacterium]
MKRYFGLGFLLPLLCLTLSCTQKEDKYGDAVEIDMAAGMPAGEVLPVEMDLSKPRAKRNVILMVADGAGFGTFYSAAAFMTGSPTGLPYQQKDWTFVSCATFHKKSFYNPQTFWEKFPEYEDVPPDSASTATALNTGVKTRNGRIGIGPNDEVLVTLAELAKKYGLTTGAVTTIQAASATPAAVVGHDAERNHGQLLLSQMLEEGNLDILIGTGHPEYDDNNHPCTPRFRKLSPSKEYWKKIKSGHLPEGWTFVEENDDFHALVTGPLPQKLFGMLQINECQAARPEGTPRSKEIPSLSELSTIALRMASRNERGFYLMIEGGAVDAANHMNHYVRCMEEMVEFNQAVQTVCDWVEKNSSWDETLVVVTADHDNGAIFGPVMGSDGTPETDPIYQGKGKMPKATYYAKDHTKMLVPVYARGPGAANLRNNISGTDPIMARIWKYDGKYIDQTEIFPVMKAALGL